MRLAWIPMLALVACSRTGSRPRASDRDVRWHDVVEVARGDAIRGPWRMNESDFRWVDDPAVDIGPDGDAFVAWVDQEKKDLFFQRFDAEGRPLLPSPVNVSKSGATFSWLPRIVVAGERVHVLWQEIVFSGGTHGGEIFYAHSRDGGRSFTEPDNLSNTSAGDGKGRESADLWDNGSLDLACGPNGAIHAVWTEYEGTLWIRTSRDGGGTWAERVRVAGTPQQPARAPSIAIAGDAAVHVAWAVGEGPSSSIRVASSADGGRSFAAPQLVGGRKHKADAPSLEADAKGNVHLAFNANGGVKYARMRRDARVFDVPKTLTTSNAGAPSLDVDARGRVHVVWEVTDGEGRARDLLYTLSLDGGDTFRDPSLLPRISAPPQGWNGSQQGRLADKLAVDDEGMVAIVNSTFEPESESRVWLLLGKVVR